MLKFLHNPYKTHRLRGEVVKSVIKMSRFGKGKYEIIIVSTMGY